MARCPYYSTLEVAKGIVDLLSHPVGKRQFPLTSLGHVIGLYCTILNFSARGVTCDHMDESALLARCNMTWDMSKNLANSAN